jgi:hypothetical protein
MRNWCSLFKQPLQKQWTCLPPCIRGPLHWGNGDSSCQAGVAATTVQVPCVWLSTSFYLETRTLLRAQLKREWREYCVLLRFLIKLFSYLHQNMWKTLSWNYTFNFALGSYYNEESVLVYELPFYIMTVHGSFMGILFVNFVDAAGRIKSCNPA